MAGKQGQRPRAGGSLREGRTVLPALVPADEKSTIAGAADNHM